MYFRASFSLFASAMIASPISSYLGLPALPAICLYSKTGMFTILDDVGSYRFIETMTLLAGRLTPAARVGVANTTLRALALKASSTALLA